jgi:hypothetical protein
MAAKLSRLLGIVFVVAGVLGFIPSLAPNGYLLGLFPVSLMHNVAHIVLGLWGLAMGGMLYLRAIALIYAALAVIGLLPMGQDFLGMIPLGGNDVWLHAGLAVFAGYFGFGKEK